MPGRMSIQDVHLLVAQARLEADEPGFKVLYSPTRVVAKLLIPWTGVFPSVRLHR